MPALLEGILAGYGIAIPVGAIAVLILEAGLNRGFRIGFMAGAGAACADFLYAALAAVAGAALVEFIHPYTVQVKVISGIVLIAVGLYGLQKSVRFSNSPAFGDTDSDQEGKVFLQFLGLTLLNPLTVAYFSALILGGGAKNLNSVYERTAFIIGAGLASLSWQTFLAGLGSFGHHRFSPRFQLTASVIGFLVVVGFGLRILLPLFQVIP